MPDSIENQAPPERFRLWATNYREFSRVIWADTKPTSEQFRIARRLGIKLQPDDSILIASSRIIDAVADSIGDTRRHDPTDKQVELAGKLEINIIGDSRRIAWAKIKQTIQRNNFNANMFAIQNLCLAPGDDVIDRRVINNPMGDDIVVEHTRTVSSIRWDGMVYFKGGFGLCSWAQFLRKPK